MLQLLAGLEAEIDGNPERGQVDCLQHSLQVANWALIEDADLEMQMVALLHDACRVISPVHHGEAAAELLKDRLSRDRYQVLRTHGVFQADLVHGTSTARRYASASWVKDAEALRSWEAMSFEPDLHVPGLDYWAPRLRDWLA